MSNPLLWAQNLFKSAGGVVSRILNNGTALAPETTTPQIDLNVVGATFAYAGPGVGETNGRLTMTVTPTTLPYLGLGKVVIGGSSVNETRQLTASDISGITTPVAVSNLVPGIVPAISTGPNSIPVSANGINATWVSSTARNQLFGINSGGFPQFMSSPALVSIFLGTNPAASGGTLLIPNGAVNGIVARNAANTSNVGLLYADSSNHANLGGTQWPLAPGSGDVGSVYYVSAANVASFAAPGSIGIRNNTDNPTIYKTPRDSNGDRIFDVTLRGSVAVPHSTTVNLPTITEATYANMGATNGSVTYQVATVELVISGEDGNFNFFQQTFRGIIYRLRTGGDAWAIDTDLTHIAGLDVGGGPSGGIAAHIVLSGTNNGDITPDVFYTYTTNPRSDWNYSVNIYGGGRYA